MTSRCRSPCQICTERRGFGTDQVDAKTGRQTSEADLPNTRSESVRSSWISRKIRCFHGLQNRLTPMAYGCKSNQTSVDLFQNGPLGSSPSTGVAASSSSTGRPSSGRSTCRTIEADQNDPNGKTTKRTLSCEKIAN